MTEISFTNTAVISRRARSRRTAMSWDEPLTDAMNVAIATAALVFLAPLMIVIALLVWAQDGGPAVFAHRRLGRDGGDFVFLYLL